MYSSDGGLPAGVQDFDGTLACLTGTNECVYCLLWRIVPCNTSRWVLPAPLLLAAVRLCSARGVLWLLGAREHRRAIPLPSLCPGTLQQQTWLLGSWLGCFV